MIEALREIDNLGQILEDLEPIRLKLLISIEDEAAGSRIPGGCSEKSESGRSRHVHYQSRVKKTKGI